jgi:hypothetical protein
MRGYTRGKQSEDEEERVEAHHNGRAVREGGCGEEGQGVRTRVHRRHAVRTPPTFVEVCSRFTACASCVAEVTASARAASSASCTPSLSTAAATASPCAAATPHMYGPILPHVRTV